MESEVLTTDVPKCTEYVGIMYSYGIQTCLHEEKVIRVVQKWILPTYKGKLLAPYSATFITLLGFLGAPCNTENMSVIYQVRKTNVQQVGAIKGGKYVHNRQHGRHGHGSVAGAWFPWNYMVMYVAVIAEQLYVLFWWNCEFLQFWPPGTRGWKSHRMGQEELNLLCLY